MIGYHLTMPWLRKTITIAAISIAGYYPVAAQNISLGTWRVHLSYDSIVAITYGADQIFAASSSGVLSVSDNTVESITPLNGLSSTGITDVAFDPTQGKLLVSYEDGVLDIIGDEVVNFDRLKQSNTITGSKRINDIYQSGPLAFLSTDYGVVVFDLNRNDLRETWRDIGENGTTIKVFDADIKGDSIYLASDKGILAGHLNTNLLDYNFWKRYDAGDLNATVKAVENFNDAIYIAIDGRGVYKKVGNQFTLAHSVSTPIDDLHSTGNQLYFISNQTVYSLDAKNAVTEISYSGIPNVLLQSADGSLWVGDAAGGLQTNRAGSFQQVPFNAPATNKTYRLTYSGNKIVALPGPLTTIQSVSIFENGLWQIKQAPSSSTDFVLSGSEFISSWQEGLQETKSDSEIIYDESNSPLKADNGAVRISDLASSSRGLWIANYNSSEPIQLYANGEFTPYSFPYLGAKFPLHIAIGLNGLVWATIDPTRGGGMFVFNPDNGQSAFKTTGVGSGALPNNNVNAIAVDRDGYVWVGTDQGVSYFYSADNDAISPLFENRFLLRSERITAIEIDGGNRKWIGTDRGVWLFNPTGESLIQNFTSSNSPLLSDRVRDIEINPVTGEVFFATEGGLISYRSDATQPVQDFNSIKIFPNPVTSSFSGSVAFEGLPFGATLKITDISGKLIWETKSNGGTASWNVRDYQGRRPATGIYLVFAAGEDGGESIVGKIAIVD